MQTHLDTAEDTRSAVQELQLSHPSVYRDSQAHPTAAIKTASDGRSTERGNEQTPQIGSTVRGQLTTVI